MIQSNVFNFKYNSDAHIGKFWVNDNFAFIKIPKNASTTILEELNLRDSDLSFQDVYNSNYKIFTTIRNPIKRLISAFIEILEPSDDYPQGRFRNVHIPHIMISDVENIWKIDDKIEKFNSYLEYLSSNGFIELHCTPQVQFLYNRDGDRIENIKMFRNDDITKTNSNLYRFLNKKEKMRNYNESNNKSLKNKLLDYISSDSSVENKIRNLYNEDFNLYNSLKNNVIYE